MREEYDLSSSEKELFEVATILRAKPPHKNHIAMLEELCKKSVRLTIIIGSANQDERGNYILNEKNPFTPKESEEMLDSVLRKKFKNYRFVYLPDFYDDEKWTEYLFERVGYFTELISNNAWVDRCVMKRQYSNGKKMFRIIRPDEIIPVERMIYVNGEYVCATLVRKAMVNDGNWKDYVPKEVSDYIERNNLVERVKKVCGKYSMTK
jgi:nicotinamide mononucleotide adenylyltransferase